MFHSYRLSRMVGFSLEGSLFKGKEYSLAPACFLFLVMRRFISCGPVVVYFFFLFNEAAFTNPKKRKKKKTQFRPQSS